MTISTIDESQRKAGRVSGFACPFTMATAKESPTTVTNSTEAAFFALAAIAFVGAMIILLLPSL